MIFFISTLVLAKSLGLIIRSWDSLVKIIRAKLGIHGPLDFEDMMDQAEEDMENDKDNSDFEVKDEEGSSTSVHRKGSMTNKKLLLIAVSREATIYFHNCVGGGVHTGSNRSEVMMTESDDIYLLTWIDMPLRYRHRYERTSVFLFSLAERMEPSDLPVYCSACFQHCFICRAPDVGMNADRCQTSLRENFLPFELTFVLL